MTRNITLKELRPKLPKVIEEIDSKMDRFIVTKRGKPTAIMMSIDEYESLVETIEILQDPRTAKKIKSSVDDLAKGKVKPLEKIEREMGIV
jgi:prevent-host-death family protein